MRNVFDGVTKTFLGLALAALVVTVTAPGRAEPADPNAGCAGCHATIAAEWEGSSHHRSATNDAYVAQLAREPLPFCRGCHAPRADAARPTPAAIAERGIGCVDCKRKLLEKLNPSQEELRAKREAILARPGDVDELVQLGNRRAREAAGRTMAEVRAAMKL